MRKESLNLLQALPLGFREEEQDKDDSGEADSRIEPERPVRAAHGAGDGGEGLDHDKHLQVCDAGGDPGQEGAHLAGVELGRVQKGDGSEPDGVGQHEGGDAEEGEPGVALQHVADAAVAVVGVEGEAEHDEGAAHDQGGAAQEGAAGEVAHGGQVHEGAEKPDESHQDGGEVLPAGAGGGLVEDLDRIEGDGVLAGEGHEQEECVEEEEGPAVLAAHHLLEEVAVGEVLLVVVAREGVGDGEELGQGVGLGGTEALHHGEGLLLLALLEVPVGRVVEEGQSGGEEEGREEGDRGHHVPVRHRAERVGGQRAQPDGGHGDGGEPPPRVGLGDLGDVHLDGGGVAGGGEAAKHPPQQHHWDVLRGGDQHPSEQVRHQQGEEGLATTEAGTQDARGEAAKYGAKAEDARWRKKFTENA